MKIPRPDSFALWGVLRYTNVMPPVIHLGIAVSAVRPPFTYAALDADRRVVALARGSLADAYAYAAGQNAAWVAISAPSRPSADYMSRAEVRAQFTPPPPAGRHLGLRVAEYELQRRGLEVTQTPPHPQDSPVWVRRGFALYQNLEQAGYQPYPAAEVARQWLETHTESVFAALLGRLPLPAHTLEGRLQRQLALFEQRLPVADPMDFFEEITRHRLLQGVLPLNLIHSAAELSALAAALVAWMAAQTPERMVRFGVPAEGEIVLPASDFFHTPPGPAQPALALFQTADAGPE